MKDIPHTNTLKSAAAKSGHRYNAEVSPDLENPSQEKEELLALETTSGLERWCKQRMSVYSSKKETFVLAIILLLGFIGGPALIFGCLSLLLTGSLGTSGDGATALAFNAFLYLLLVTWTIVLGRLIFRNVNKPTHLRINGQGMRYEYHTLFGTFRGRPILWQDVQRIDLIKPRGTINPEKYSLRFHVSPPKHFDLPMHWLNKPETKDKFSDAVAKHLDHSDRDLEAAYLLQAPAGNSFTELWFQSLDAVGRAETPGALTESDARNLSL